MMAFSKPYGTIYKISPNPSFPKRGINKQRMTHRKARRTIFQSQSTATTQTSSNLSDIKKAIVDFAKALESGKADSYKLVVFLGNHPDEKVRSILDEIEKHMSDKNFSDKFELVHNSKATLIDIAKLKAYYKAKVLVELAKPGEHPFDAPQVGTFFLGLKASSLNEVDNLKFVVKNWESALPSAWGDDYDYWLRSGFNPDNSVGFDRRWENLFEYLDYLFGNNIANRNIAKEKALNGLAKARRNASLFLSAMAMGVAIDADETKLHGPSASNNRQRMRNLIEQRDRLDDSSVHKTVGIPQK